MKNTKHLLLLVNSIYNLIDKIKRIAILKCCHQKAPYQTCWHQHLHTNYLLKDLVLTGFESTLSQTIFFCSYITVSQYYTQLNVKHGEGKVNLGEIRGSLFLVVNYNNYF